MKLNNLLAALTVILCLNSCDNMEDLLYMFDKARDDAYITNQTDCDVTIRRKYFYHTEENPGDSLYIIAAGQQLEIPVTDHWSMSRHFYEFDTVWFYFADGTSYIHTAHSMRDMYGNDSIVYNPSDYNILKINTLSTKKEDNCWTHSKIKGRHYRYDFYVTDQGK